MAYIGRVPQVGNYFTLDAITASSTATYNLLKGGVAYVPETAYHLIVSLNGVIQAPITAYTVSGSTITFASSLSSSDTIDFITVLGDTLAIGTPSDDTVSTAKIQSSAVTDAKIADVAATKLTGSIADARVPSSAVTQHVTGYDDSAIRADISALALREATNETSAAFNLPNSFIDTFATDVLGTKTDVAVTSGYVSTIQAETGLVLLSDGGETNAVFQNKASGSDVSADQEQGSSFRSTTQEKFGSYSHYFQHSGSSDTNNQWAKFNANANWSWGTGDFSIDFFMYQTGGSYEYSNMGLDTNEAHSSGGNWWIRVNEWNENRVRFQTAGTSSTVVSFYTGTNVWSDNTWHHICIARKSGDFKIFVDGVSKSISFSTGGNGNSYQIGNTTQPLYIGRSATGQGFLGYMDAIRMYKGTAKYFDSNFTPPATQPVSTVASATGTAIQAANTVGSAKTEVSGTMIYKDNAGTATLGTDLKIYFTCNGGSNWTEAASYNAITPVYATGIKQVRLGKTTCTSGTDVRYKAVWANQAEGSKDTQLHGIGINY